MINFKIKKNDAVVVISGKNRGKHGKVLQVFPQTHKVVVEGVALKKRHRRPKRSGQKGEIVTLPSPIDISNIMLFCPHCSRGVRTGYLIEQASGRKNRVCRKCKNET